MAWVAVGVGGASLVGGYLSSKSASNASAAQSAAQLEAARLGAGQAAFRPVGMTTGFGSSNFVMGPDGRLQSAGYNLNPQMQSQFNTLQNMAGANLGQYQQGQQYAQPLLQGAQGMMGLGQGYLQQDPQAQAAQYMAQQQALLAPSREQQLSGVRQGLFNTGRGGLAMGATNAGGLQATNPEMAAYYNAIAQQDLGLAATAQQGGMQNAQFGAGMMGSGASTLGNYYNAQNAALSPYQTALGAAQGIDTMGQNAMSIGQSLGAGNQTSGNLLAGGGMNAANSMYNANAPSMWGQALQSAGNTLGGMKFNTQPSYSTGNNPSGGPSNQYSDPSTWGPVSGGQDYSGFGEYANG